MSAVTSVAGNTVNLYVVDTSFAAKTLLSLDKQEYKVMSGSKAPETNLVATVGSQC